MSQFKLSQEAMTRALSARGNSLDLERQIMVALNYEIEQGTLVVAAEMLPASPIDSPDVQKLMQQRYFLAPGFEEPGPVPLMGSALLMSWETNAAPDGPYVVAIEELGDGLEDYVVVRDEEIYYSSADRGEAEAVCSALNWYEKGK